MKKRQISIQERVLNQIDKDKVQPTPAWRFVAKEYVMILLWLLSVLVGAIAVAVTVYVVNYQRYAFYEATHDHWEMLLLEMLPWLWLLVLLVGLCIAAYYQKHLRRGYRYPLWILFATSASASVLVGVLLQAYGMGFTVDVMAAKYMPMYTSQAKREAAMWQDPMQGRLLGKQVYETTATSGIVIFADQSGERWRTDVSELSSEDIELLNSGKKVRLLGLMNNELVRSFHACGAFPWMADKPMKNAELAAERAAFIRRVYRHDYGGKVDEGKIVVEAVLATNTNALPPGRCQQLPAIHRMHKEME